MTVFPRLVLILSLSALILSLSSCGSTPVKSNKSAEETLTLENIQSYIDKRKGLNTTEISARLIRAADFLLRKNELDRAHSLIDTVDINNTAETEKLQYLLVNAKIALAEGEPYIARRFFYNQNVESFVSTSNEDIAVDFFDMRAQLMFDQGEFLASIEDRLNISTYLIDDELSLQLNHDLIWEALAALPTETLYEYSKAERNATKQGWFSLAALSKSNGANYRQQIVDIEKWQTVWPDHPASRLLPADLQLILQLADQQALNIAVLLPLSGKHSGIGGAIKEGILAAYYDDVSQHTITPRIEFFDTSSQEVNSLYDQAQNDGFELVIGPLNKENVAAISEREYLPIPVLALNSPPESKPETTLSEDQGDSFGFAPQKEDIDTEQLETDIVAVPNESVFYFSLAVENEARQVAERAWRDGHRRSLIIAPYTSWGDRASNAFKQAWLEIGGELVDDKRYRDQRSYSALIEESVAVDKSKSRKRELQRLLGSNLEFEPRRRKDVDFIFLLAYPKDARQLLPLLAYHYAGDIPVYSTSQVFSEDNNGSLSDLNGLRFSAMPWHFDSQLSERRAIQAYGENLAPYQTLYALGVDAYHIYPRLEQLQLLPQAQFYGTTGKLRVIENNIIERTQDWAEINRGVAVELQSGIEQSSEL